MEINDLLEKLKEAEEVLSYFDGVSGLLTESFDRLEKARNKLRSQKIQILDLLMKFCHGQCIHVRYGQIYETLVDISLDGKSLRIRPFTEEYSVQDVVDNVRRLSGGVSFQSLATSLLLSTEGDIQRMSSDSAFLREQIEKLKDFLNGQ